MSNFIKGCYIGINMFAISWGLTRGIIVLAVGEIYRSLESFSSPINLAVGVCIIIAFLGYFGAVRNNTVMIAVHVCLMTAFLVLDAISSGIFGKTDHPLTKVIDTIPVPGFILVIIPLLQLCALPVLKLQDEANARIRAGTNASSRQQGSLAPI